MAGKYQAPTVKKAFQILDRIAQARNGLKISDLSVALGISKSTVHGITAALEEQGAVVRETQTKRYRLGFTLFELGRKVHVRTDLKDIARPFMEALMEKIGESVFLGICNGDHVTILDIVESMNDLKITSPIGTTIPLLAGATGKVFLSGMTDSKADQLVRTRGLVQYTPSSIVTRESFLAEVAQARRNGYATDDEEYIPGVRAVAAPVKNIEPLMAAIWVVGFKPSMNGGKTSGLVIDTRQTAEAISRKIDAMKRNGHDIKA
jgi:DNA-binding IclR family transcriptional regulator